MLLLLATIMPKENEADIAVLVSRTERAQDGETMVALTVRDARKWRISSQANCWFRVSPKASPCKPRDKGEADLRRARSDDTLLQAVPGRTAHVCSLLARPIVSLGDAARRSDGGDIASRGCAASLWA